MDRLIIRGEPVGEFQKVAVFYNGEKIDNIGIKFEDLIEIVFELLAKYHLNRIDLSGSRAYMEGIQQMVQEAAIKEYGIDNLTFKYV